MNNGKLGGRSEVCEGGIGQVACVEIGQFQCRQRGEHGQMLVGQGLQSRCVEFDKAL